MSHTLFKLERLKERLRNKQKNCKILDSARFHKFNKFSLQLRILYVQIFQLRILTFDYLAFLGHKMDFPIISTLSQIP